MTVKYFESAFVACGTAFKLIDNYTGSVESLSSLCVIRSRSLIQAALLKNDLLKNLDEGEMRAVTSCLYRCSINQSCSVIQEGSAGEQAFILEGKLQPSVILEIIICEEGG